MPAIGVTLERLVSDSYEIDTWQGDLSGDQTVTVSDLQVSHALPSIDSLFESAELGSDEPQEFAIIDPSATQPIATLPIRLIRRYKTFTTAEQIWRDSSGGLTVTLSRSLEHDTVDINVSWQQPDGISTASLLSMLQILAELKAPNYVILRDSLGDPWGTASFPQGLNGQLNFDLYLHIVELLDRVQRLSNTFFPMPEQLSQGDINELVRADYLLRGEILTGTWKESTISLTPTASGLEILDGQADEAPFLVAQEQTSLIAGNAIFLGSIVTHLLSARIEHWDGDGDNSSGRLTLVPASTNEFESWRIDGEDTQVNNTIPGVSRRFRQQLADSMDQYEELLRRLAE